MKNIDYSDAVEKARKLFFAVSRTGSSAHSVKGIHESGGLRASMLQGAGVHRLKKDPESLLSDSRTDPDAFDALRFGCAALLIMDFELAASVKQWVSAYLVGKVERPTAKEGRPSSIGLHMLIVQAVDELVEEGMNATRNDASPPISACDAVAEALAKVALRPTSYDRVKRIYLELKRLQNADGSYSVPAFRKASR